MKIIKTKIPQSSLLYPNHNLYNYIDSYEGIISDEMNKIKKTNNSSNCLMVFYFLKLVLTSKYTE